MANVKVRIVSSQDPRVFDEKMNSALDAYRGKGYVITDIQYGGCTGSVFNAMIMYAPPQKA